jgi:hypothetical protein
MSRRKRHLNDLRHTAIHEAGHAVIGRVLGMTCGHATRFQLGNFTSRRAE